MKIIENKKISNIQRNYGNSHHQISCPKQCRQKYRKKMNKMRLKSVNLGFNIHWQYLLNITARLPVSSWKWVGCWKQSWPIVNREILERHKLITFHEPKNGGFQANYQLESQWGTASEVSNQGLDIFFWDIGCQTLYM